MREANISSNGSGEASLKAFGLSLKNLHLNGKTFIDIMFKLFFDVVFLIDFSIEMNALKNSFLFIKDKKDK